MKQSTQTYLIFNVKFIKGKRLQRRKNMKDYEERIKCVYATWEAKTMTATRAFKASKAFIVNKKHF